MPRAVLLPALLAAACAVPDAPHADPTKQQTEAAERTEERRVRWGSPMPPEGTVCVVLAVGEDRVVISAGSLDGVRVGDYFDISRAGARVGTIRIRSVDDRYLATGVLDESRAAGSDVRAGDKATRISPPAGP